MKKGFFLLAQVLLLVITINICGVEGQCLPTNSTGCLNGVEYSFDTQFACRSLFFFLFSFYTSKYKYKLRVNYII